MHRKTRKQRAGALSKLPRSVAPVTEDKKADINNFFKNNRVYYVSAHGAVLTDKKHKVPPNTYILHAVDSGKLLYVNKSELPQFVTEYHETLLWDLLTGQSEGTEGTRLFSPNKFRIEQGDLAIYEPGDMVSDMLFHFSNEGPENLAITMNGVYKVPIASELLDRAKQFEAEKSRDIYRVTQSSEYKAMTDEAEKKQARDRVSVEFARATDDIFRTNSSNKLRGYFNRALNNSEESKRYEMKESQLINDTTTFSPPDGGIRLFIVFACRGPYCPPGEREQRESRRVRRESLALRTYTANQQALLKKFAEEQEEKNRKAEEEEKRAEAEKKRVEKLQADFFRGLASGKPIRIANEALAFMKQAEKEAEKEKNLKEKKNRKTRRNKTWRNLNRYLDKGDEKVLPAIKALLTPEELKELNDINNIQSRRKRYAYAEVLKKLKRRLLDEEYANNNA